MTEPNEKDWEKADKFIKLASVPSLFRVVIASEYAELRAEKEEAVRKAEELGYLMGLRWSKTHNALLDAEIRRLERVFILYQQAADRAKERK